jgi:hypothetical protein
MTGINSIPVYFSEDSPLEFGNGEAAASAPTLINGHTVALASGDTFSSVGGVHERWVRLINLDSNEYMANASVTINAASCPTCSGALFDNADMIIVGVNCNAAPPAAFGCSADIDTGAGYQYVEDGDFVTLPEPWNPKGATYQESRGVDVVIGAVRQIIHPECGSVTTPWVFSNNDANYEFWATVTADYFPYGDMSDSRYDLADRTTFYAQVSDLTDAYLGPGTGPNPLFYRRSWAQGTPARSNVLSGYGKEASNVVAPGTQLGVMISLEYSDRFENDIVARPDLVTDMASGYEYYIQVAAILRYNPAVITSVAGPNSYCFNTNYCGVNYQNYNGFNLNANSGGAPGDGWVAMTYGQGDTWTFSAFGSYINYRTASGAQVYFSGNFSNLCQNCGQKGRAHLNVVPTLAATLTSGYALSTVWVQEGPDADPDQILALYLMTVDAGAASGSGSEFWFDTYAGDTGLLSYHTKGSFWDSGRGSDDWTNYCYPMSGSYMDNFNQGCDPVDHPTQIIRASQGERANYEILHSGKATPRMSNLQNWGYPRASVGHFQQWPAHICVQ